ncbi:hypothetical protein PybrP1_003267 [[Pythium] brassicae (nom. inval.)]|nr:hypothetical protein PybrP1_003267 [[Pythium] brassicae (nom. inval.)]
MVRPPDQWVFAELRALVTAPRGATAPAAPEFRTASRVEAGVSWATERQLRRATCAFVEDLAALVELPDAPAVAAQLFVQRFFVLQSFVRHDRFLVATAALFLAAKTEEFPIKVRLLTECALFLLHCAAPPKEELLKKSRSRQQHQQQHQHQQQQHHSQQQSATSGGAAASNGGGGARRKNSAGKLVEMSASLGNDPEAANAKHLDCLNALLEVIDVGEVETTSAKVLLLERVVLQTLAFDVCAPQPFAYVARHMEALFALEAVHPAVPYGDIRSLAFLLLADAVKSGLCLAFTALELAAGAVYLAGLYRRTVSPNVATEANAPWWSVFGLSPEQLEGARGGATWWRG